MSNILKIEKYSFNRKVLRNKIIKKVGLDTDIFVNLVDDREQYSNYLPKIFNRQNYIHICGEVIGQSIFVLVKKRNYEERIARKKVFDYIKNHNIHLIKRKNFTVEQSNSLELLKNNLLQYRDRIKGRAEDSDIRIIAIYALFGINCIFTINARHFIPICNHINIDVEKPIDDLNEKIKNAFGWKTRNKKRY